MRVAILGAGRIGALHSRLLAAHPDVETLLVADERPDRARVLAASVEGEPAPPTSS
jgi:myo-inositol 2-dehydrogenase/D-chiro-inositol 1-dehydrogenase